MGFAGFKLIAPEIYGGMAEMPENVCNFLLKL
jgi:hypothetical protein